MDLPTALNRSTRERALELGPGGSLGRRGWAPRRAARRRRREVAVGADAAALEGRDARPRRVDGRAEVLDLLAEADGELGEVVVGDVVLGERVRLEGGLEAAEEVEVVPELVGDSARNGERVERAQNLAPVPPLPA